MLDMIQIPTELACFELPQAVQERLQFLLDQQDSGIVLSTAERLEAEGLVELSEFLSLLKLRAQQVPEHSDSSPLQNQNFETLAAQLAKNLQNVPSLSDYAGIYEQHP